MQTQTGAIVRFDATQQKFLICSVNASSEEPLYEIRLGINYPFLFESIKDADSILNRPLEEDTDIVANYYAGGQITKTAKLLCIQEASQPVKAIFLYDDLTKEQYEKKYPKDVLKGC